MPQSPPPSPGTNHPSVCVVIVNYNGGAMLTDCVQSVLASGVPVAVHISDNGSQDGSIAHLRASLGDDSRVNVIHNGTNLGFARGNNVVFSLCRSEYILCLNADAILAEDCLDKLLQVAQERDEFASFAGRMVQSEQRTVLDGAGDAYHVSGLVWRRGYGSSLNSGDYAESKEVFSACAAAALYRRTALEAVGGFDEDFFCYLEDIDLGFRLRLAGYRCLYVPHAMVYHVGSATTGKGSDFSVYHGHRNLVWTYVKNMPGLLFWLYLPQHVAANLYIIFRYARLGRWRIVLKAKWDAIKGLPRMWPKRKEIQARRVVGMWEIRRTMEKGRPRLRR
jgi:GT2 family glycosyltransferase